MENQINPIEQTKAYHKMSEKYGQVTTSDILDVFAKRGWHLVSKTVSNPRDKTKLGYQKHLLRLENPAYSEIKGLSKDNASRPQLVLLNSHDGSTSLRMFFGILRIACLNGIIAGSGVTDFRAVHNKNITKRVDQGIKEITDNLPKLLDMVAQLQGKSYTVDAERKLMFDLVKARLANVKNIVHINYSSIIKPQRDADNGNDCYTVFNRLQEYIIRGGIEYTYQKAIKDKDGNVLYHRLVTTKTRRLGSISSQVALNQYAWDRALQLAA